MWKKVAFYVLLAAALCQVTALKGPDVASRPVSIITGANGYVGRAVAKSLLSHNQNSDQTIVCLVRQERVNAEQEFWRHEPCINVRPYDMLDGGSSIKQALESVYSETNAPSICVYHVASWFSPTEDHEQKARGNVQGTVDLVNVLGGFPNCKLVLTSSMAAVRATSQAPKNGEYYTAQDWNTVSKLGENWGSR